MLSRKDLKKLLKLTVRFDQTRWKNQIENKLQLSDCKGKNEKLKMGQRHRGLIYRIAYINKPTFVDIIILVIQWVTVKEAYWLLEF